MKKILQIVDTYSWAIGHLSKNIVDGNPQYDWRMMEVHPKGLERGEIPLEPIREAILWADLVDIQYWRTCSQLLEMIPELKQKKIVLTHHNDKDLFSGDWSDVDHIVGKTNYACTELDKKYPNKVSKIPVSVDLNYFQYHGKDPEKPKVGYVGRIVPWKGLKEVARACYELGYPLLVMGKMDKPSYWAEIPEEHRQNMDLHWFDCDDDQRMDAYKQMTIYVGNSGPGRESGTMPMLEAMATGVPMVSTPSGLGADILEHNENALVVDFNDYDQLKEAIKELMELPALRQKLRTNAWDTVKGINFYRYASMYSRVYNSVMHNGKDLVSVVIPATLDRKELVQAIVKSFDNQTYDNIEILVIWDNLKSEMSEKINLESIHPVKQTITDKEGYNLAMARNLGIIEAEGEYILFCDSRIKPDREAIEKFITYKTDCWLFGDKGGQKKTFVENFSFIKRQTIINGGMFNERIYLYGGMSQEIRSRFTAQGICFEYVPEAKAETLITTRKDNQRRSDIIKMKNLLWKIGL